MEYYIHAAKAKNISSPYNNMELYIAIVLFNFKINTINNELPQKDKFIYVLYLCIYLSRNIIYNINFVFFL